MTPRKLKLFGLGLVGVAGTAVAAVLAFAPSALAELRPVLQRVTDTVQPLWVGALLALAGLLAAWHVGHSERAETPFDGARTPPESVTADEAALAGATLDARYEAAVADEPGAMAAMVDRLRTTAVRSYTLAADVSSERADRAVAAGEWTDDRVAAAVLSPDTTQPLLARLRLWLDPESERERRLRRTVGAIEELGEEGR